MSEPERKFIMSSKEQFLDAVFAPSAPRLVNMRFCRMDQTKTVPDDEFSARAKHVLFRINNNLTAATLSFPSDSTKSVDTAAIAANYL